MEKSYEQQRREYLMDKYKIGGRLILESDPKPQEETTVRDLQIANDREAMKGFKTCIARVGKQKLWFDVKL